MTKHIKYIVIGIVSCVAIGWLCFYIFRWEHRSEMLEVYFFNLNRGHSVFIRTPHDKTILIDGGQSGDVVGELTKLFPFYRRRIDTMIVTNGSPKNVGGLVEVTSRFAVGEIIEPSMMATSTALETFHKIVQEKTLPTRSVQKGDRFEVDSVVFDVLFPDPDFGFNKSSLPELVLKMKYRDEAFLFMGDVSPKIQKSLITELGPISLVEFAHAGSKSRVSSDFMEATNAGIVITTKTVERNCSTPDELLICVK